MKAARNIAFAVLMGVTMVNFSYAQDKMSGKKMELKEHKCTAACKDGKHMYAHGEKGHTCTKACKKMNKSTKM